jgi:hypothetical protein
MSNWSVNLPVPCIHLISHGQPTFWPIKSIAGEINLVWFDGLIQETEGLKSDPRQVFSWVR